MKKQRGSERSINIGNLSRHAICQKESLKCPKQGRRPRYVPEYPSWCTNELWISYKYNCQRQSPQDFLTTSTQLRIFKSIVNSSFFSRLNIIGTSQHGRFLFWISISNHIIICIMNPGLKILHAHHYSTTYPNPHHPFYLSNSWVLDCRFVLNFYWSNSNSSSCHLQNPRCTNRSRNIVM